MGIEHAIVQIPIYNYAMPKIAGAKLWYLGKVNYVES